MTCSDSSVGAAGCERIMSVVPKLLKISECYRNSFCQLDPVAVTTGQTGRSKNEP